MKSLSVTFTYVLVSVPLKLIFALVVAVLMNQKPTAACRFTHPCITSQHSGGSGGHRGAGSAVSKKRAAERPAEPSASPTQAGWITNPKLTLWTLILLTVWQFGSSMIIFLAGLKRIPAGILRGSQRGWCEQDTAVFSDYPPLALAGYSVYLVLQTITTFQAFTGPISSAAAAAACSTPRCSTRSTCISRDGNTTRWDMHPDGLGAADHYRRVHQRLSSNHRTCGCRMGPGSNMKIAPLPATLTICSSSPWAVDDLPHALDDCPARSSPTT